MRKRTSMILFCTALLAIGLVFAGTEAKADNEKFLQPNDNCTLTSASGATGGTVELQRPVLDNTWVYEFTGISSRTNQISMILPVCDPNVDFVGSGVASWELLDPGEGEAATDFDYGNFQYRVFRTSPVLIGSNGAITVVSSVETATRATSLLLKSGNTHYFCKNLSAPACAGLSTSSVTASQEIVAKNGKKFGVVFDKYSQCATSVTCGGDPCPSTTDFPNPIPYAEVPFGHSWLKNLSSPGQACTSILIEDEGDSSTWYCSGGWCWYY